MMRRLTRLLVIALLLAIIAYAASRLMGGDDDDDFDDFEDLDSGFEFQETPVEIDVPAAEPSAPTRQGGTAPFATAEPADAVHSSKQTALLEETAQPAAQSASAASAAGATDTTMGSTDDGNLIDIIGIGPAYEARLQAIGITSIKDLAGANAEALASQIEVIGGTATIDDWINQAKSHGAQSQS